jgi:hypothetical protein
MEEKKRAASTQRTLTMVRERGVEPMRSAAEAFTCVLPVCLAGDPCLVACVEITCR